MTLTVCVGSSGSGKTTFLEDVYKSHRCTYIRQYHTARPYIRVCTIPNFDPTQLPYWDIYVREGKAASIQVGGTMAGEFTAGLSGGQRKLLLFELVFQRTASQSELLICLDEPFAGVTDDFVPFIVQRLEEMRQKHNVLLVTNDHVATLTEMADNTITVSAIDRSVVRVNDRVAVNREKMIQALSVGDTYAFTTTGEDLKFFFDTEIRSSSSLLAVAVFTTFCWTLFLATFWDSDESSAALVLVAGGTIGFFCVNPYLLSLVEWRNTMVEEAGALLHASKGMNKTLKCVLTVFVVFIVSTLEYGLVNAVIDGLSSAKYWVAIQFDSGSLLFPLICLGLFTRMPFQAVQILGSLPFLLMIFLSTTFSPGSGVPVIKELRYIYARFYFWCMLPSVQDLMEGCPDDDVNLLYLVLSALLFLIIFLFVKAIGLIKKRMKRTEKAMKNESMKDSEYHDLQLELYGKKVLKRLQHMPSTSLYSSKTTRQSSGVSIGIGVMDFVDENDEVVA